MVYIDCQKYATEILDSVKQATKKKVLSIISVGNNPAAQSYIKGKIKDCEYCGIPYKLINLDSTCDTNRLIRNIQIEQKDDSVGGIIVEFPLPKHIDISLVKWAIAGNKDVDNISGSSKFGSCTIEAIMYLIKQEMGADITGLDVLVIGRGRIGKPLAKALLDADCTVTIAHSKTVDLHTLTANYDIVISTAGTPKLVDLRYCYNAKLVIDAGVSLNANGKLVGDCFNFLNDSYENLRVTPVPKGIGLLTRAKLMLHMILGDVL